MPRLAPHEPPRQSTVASACSPSGDMGAAAEVRPAPPLSLHPASPGHQTSLPLRSGMAICDAAVVSVALCSGEDDAALPITQALVLMFPHEFRSITSERAALERRWGEGEGDGMGTRGMGMGAGGAEAQGRQGRCAVFVWAVFVLHGAGPATDVHACALLAC